MSGPPSWLQPPGDTPTASALSLTPPDLSSSYDEEDEDNENDEQEEEDEYRETRLPP